jgi:hypothetical protein
VIFDLGKLTFAQCNGPGCNLQRRLAGKIVDNFQLNLFAKKLKTVKIYSS